MIEDKKKNRFLPHKYEVVVPSLPKPRSVPDSAPSVPDPVTPPPDPEVQEDLTDAEQKRISRLGEVLEYIRDYQILHKASPDAVDVAVHFHIEVQSARNIISILRKCGHLRDNPIRWYVSDVVLTHSQRKRKPRKAPASSASRPRKTTRRGRR